MVSPFIPSSFVYGDMPQGGQIAPMVVAGRDPSDSTDKNYAAGYLWLSSLDMSVNGVAGSGNMFVQSGNSAGLPNWVSVTAGSAGALNTLSDGSTQVSPVGGNITLEGTANQVTVTSSAPAHELIFSIPAVFIAPGSIASTTSMTVGTNLTVTNDATIGNDLTVTNDASVGGNLSVTGTISFGGLSVDGTVAINTAGGGTTTVGNAAAGAITFDVGSGDFQINGGGNEIHIGDDAAANLITIGSLTGAASLVLQVGTGDFALEGAVTSAMTIGSALQTGLITIGQSTAGQDISIGSAINVGAQEIDIANGASAANSTVKILSGIGTAGAGTLLLGNNTRVTVASLADVAPAASRTVTVGGGTITTAVTDTIDIGPDGATTNAGATKTVNINTGGVTLGSVLTNIATGAVTSGTHTTSIASGNRAGGTMAVNLLTGTGTKTLNVGNADGLTTSNVKGPTNINASQNNNTAINSGTSTGTVTIGNAAAGAITIDSAAGISLDAATASNFTVTGVADLTLSSVGGSVVVSGTEAAVDAVTINATTVGGGIDVNAGSGGITVDSTGAFSIDGADNSNVTVTGAGKDLTLSSVLGSVLVSSTEDAALAIRLHADGGVTETIQLHSDQGTSASSINLLSDVGGILLQSTGMANADAIKLNSVAGGVHTVSALQTLITSSQAADTAVQITASDAAGGITLTATGTGNINMAGNVLKSTNPAFLGYLAATVNNKTGDGTTYTLGTDALTEVYDRGTNFTTAGVFTAPVTGIYDLRAQVDVSGCTIATGFTIAIVTTTRTYSYTFNKAAGSQSETVSISALCDMTATNTAHVNITVTGEAAATCEITGGATLQTYFCGALVA